MLWLLENNPEATRNLRREAQARAVDERRLIFAPHIKLSEHLARHRLAGLFLDTLPHGAHTTVSDALWAGASRSHLHGHDLLPDALRQACFMRSECPN